MTASSLPEHFSAHQDTIRRCWTLPQGEVDETLDRLFAEKHARQWRVELARTAPVSVG